MSDKKHCFADNAEAIAAIKAKTGKEVRKEDAAKETIAYHILKEHNTSDNMDKLKIKFDKLTSHDITFVGIIQTARASGLTKFFDTTTMYKYTIPYYESKGQLFSKLFTAFIKVANKL